MAVFFDGIDDNLATSQDGAAGVDTNGFTMAWFFLVQSAISFNDSIVDFEDSLVASTVFRTLEIVAPASSGFRPRLFHSFSGTDGRWRISSDLAFGQWYHIVIAYDSSLTTNDPSMYLDNANAAITEEAAPTGTRNTCFDTLFLGGSSVGENLAGNIAFVSIDAGSLWDAVQINRHYWYGTIGGGIELVYPLATNDYTNKGTTSGATLSANNGPITVSALMNALKGFVLLRSCT